MDESIQSITTTWLEQARLKDRAAWERLIDVYSPLVWHWCYRKGLSYADCEDVAQQVFLAVWRSLGNFEHQSFRGWLRTTTENKIVDFWRARSKEPGAEGGTSFQKQINQLPDNAQVNGAPTDQDEDIRLQNSVLELVSSEFCSQDVEAFRRLVIDEKSPAEVAEELGMTRNQVYLAKSRILKKLREGGKTES